MAFYTSEYNDFMEKLFDKLTNNYNLKYNTNLNFTGTMKAYINKDNYYIYCHLIVKDSSNNIISNTTKDFNIYNKTNLYIGVYELIDIYDDIDELVKVTQNMF